MEGMAVIDAYETATKFLPNLGIPEKEREVLSVKLGIVSH